MADDDGGDDNERCESVHIATHIYRVYHWSIGAAARFSRITRAESQSHRLNANVMNVCVGSPVKHERNVKQFYGNQFLSS